jgi:hypothetical protein
MTAHPEVIHMSGKRPNRTSGPDERIRGLSPPNGVLGRITGRPPRVPNPAAPGRMQRMLWKLLALAGCMLLANAQRA